MNYRIELTAQAEQEIESSYRYIAERAPQAAKRWNQGIRAAIRSLARQPRRFGLAPESEHFPFEVRQLLYGRKRNYRIIYTIKDDFVAILAVRHAAQDRLDPNDF